jgi:ADP-ribose pyrophosphatase YjhB (NUDIX family)
VTSKIPAGDNRLRYCCEGCGAIHYQNPRLVVGTVPIYGQHVLLCKRAIEPRYGYWTLPAGFMENGETVSQGAERETQEEAGANINMGMLFSVLDVPHVHQVHVFYLATMLDPSLNPGEETLEAKLFDEADIPWDELAFPTVKNTLRWYFEDRAAGRLSAGAATSDLAPHQKSLVPPLRPKT